MNPVSRLHLPALVVCGAAMLAACGEVIHREYYVPRTSVVVLKSDLSCDNPVVLAIGCGKYKLANLAVSLHGIEMSLASTEDGTGLLLWSPGNNNYSSMTANLAFDAVRTELGRNGVHVLSTTAVIGAHFAGADIVMGYLLELDQDGYRYLSPFVVAKAD